MAIKHILFDLDGTLLPMVQDEFVRFYMPLLAKAYLKNAIIFSFFSQTGKHSGVILMNSCRFLWKNQRQLRTHFTRMNSIRPSVRHSRHHFQIWL